MLTTFCRFHQLIHILPLQRMTLHHVAAAFSIECFRTGDGKMQSLDATLVKLACCCVIHNVVSCAALCLSSGCHASLAFHMHMQNVCDYSRICACSVARWLFLCSLLGKLICCKSKVTTENHCFTSTKYRIINI